MTRLLTAAKLLEIAANLRAKLERGFDQDTALPGAWRCEVPSSGQCAAVALIVHDTLGGSLVSAHVNGISHWFNRITTSDGELDIDITADQFGFVPIRIGDPGSLYANERIRSKAELRVETVSRAQLLKARAGL